MKEGKNGPDLLLDRLRSGSLRLTAQRRAVSEVLSGHNVHLTAEEVLAKARQILPEISRATVYNTLRELVEMGELNEVQIFPGPAYYDPNGIVYHHHLVCEDCGRIRDVMPEGVESLELAEEDAEGFHLRKIEIIFRGRCEDCES